MANRPLARMLECAAITHADAIALRNDSLTLTYGQMLDSARVLAEQLRRNGAHDRTTIMVKVSNHPLDFVAFLAIWLARAVVVPVHRTAPAGVVAAMQNKAQCVLCVDLKADSNSRLDIAPLAHLRHDQVERAQLRDAALVIFTSGSTGLPKGVVLTHAAFADKLAQNQRLLGMRPDDVTLLVLNNSFSYGIWSALITLNHGGTVVTQPRFSAHAFLDALVHQRVSRVGVVPTMMRTMFGALTERELAQYVQRISATGSLRDVVIGGESLGAQLSARLRGFIAPVPLYDIYGLTETSTCDFILRPQDYVEHPNSIGQSAVGVTFRIVAEDQTECAPGQIGELQLRSRFIMAGYLADPVLTAAAFDGDWFRTGDLASSDPHGFVTVVGRLKELIVRGGNKITPLEVERALMGCPGVAAALVAGTADAVLGERIQALLIAKVGERIDAQALRAALQQRLEKYKMPDGCYLTEQLPTGRTGKIDRTQVPAMIASGAVIALPEWRN
jgi:long-chain acyl-CoA synthetase